MRILVPEWLGTRCSKDNGRIDMFGQDYSIYTSSQAWERGGKAVAVIGAFDGLHRGHRLLVDAACSEARSHAMPCVAITFDPDPASRPGGGEPMTGLRLMHCHERIRGLLALGADAVIAYQFDHQLARTAPAEFVKSVLWPLVNPLSIHVGSNFRFGRDGIGDVELLRRIGECMGFAVHDHELVQSGGEVVSATRIRHLLKQARLEEAQHLLCRCHYVSGHVEHGRGEGTSFGFPTANVRFDVQDCVPQAGVYAGAVVCEERMWPAAINVGAPSTFMTQDNTLLEANLLGFDGDLYNKHVDVLFHAWLRGERTFESVEELEQTVRANIAWVGRNIGSRELEALP